MFAYCLNNPANMADTTGNLPFFVITAAVGAVVGAVVGGVVAASNGGNVWAGIGIGAAAGALIGTGVGMATGAALASSITATTEAVMAGGSALVAAVGSGGLGAGAMYVAENVSRALNGGGTALYSGGERALQAARNSGGKVINDSIGKVAEFIVKYMPWEQAKPVWQDFSAQFCKQASGIVNAYICNSAYQGVDSVFWSIEMPALLGNPRVTEIVIHIFE